MSSQASQGARKCGIAVCRERVPPDALLSCTSTPAMRLLYAGLSRSSYSIYPSSSAVSLGICLDTRTSVNVIGLSNGAWAPRFYSFRVFSMAAPNPSHHTQHTETEIWRKFRLSGYIRSSYVRLQFFVLLFKRIILPLQCSGSILLRRTQTMRALSPVISGVQSCTYPSCHHWIII